MNHTVQFSPAQSRTLSCLAVIIVAAAGYTIFTDFYVSPRMVVMQDKPAISENYASILQLDINTSPADSLELAPGIGPVLAGRIIAYRSKHGPFASFDSLTNVSGIGPVSLEKLRPYFKAVAP